MNTLIQNYAVSFKFYDWWGVYGDFSLVKGQRVCIPISKIISNKFLPRKLRLNGTCRGQF